jgi:alpha-amylase/alpha-mannosidase (GH57 family)
MPPRFSYPQDAVAQVEKAAQFYRKTFGLSPTGMWPAEGSVSEDVIPAFLGSGIEWIATADRVLFKSKPAGLKLYYPYAAGARSMHIRGGRSEEGKDPAGIVVVFRDTPLSDKIGFRYQNYYGEEAADDFVRSVLHYAPREGEQDRLLSVILDGENAWEWYKKDVDGKDFLNALYRKLEKLDSTRQIVTVTPTEYIRGNPKRGIPAHPAESLTKLEYLWPGSWVAPDYRIWIGEGEENRAWEYLLKARTALEKSGIRRPSPLDEAPAPGTKEWYRWMAWEEMYAAEGSDWFWWYGGDQSAPGGDGPFDRAFITHLENVYRFAREYGAEMDEPDFAPIVAPVGKKPLVEGEEVNVVFECDPGGKSVPEAIYIVGDRAELGSWTPNEIRMYDDGTHGDAVAGDGIWSIGLEFGEGAYIEYKYTNSGEVGIWSPSEEFPVTNRSLQVSDPDGDGKQVVRDVFGVIE